MPKKSFFDEEISSAERRWWNIYVFLGIILLTYLSVSLFVSTYIIHSFIWIFWGWLLIMSIVFFYVGYQVIKSKSFYLFWFSKTIHGKSAIVIGICHILASLMFLIMFLFSIYANYIV